MLSDKEIDQLLLEYKKDSTKLAKSVHHTQFLSECQKDRKIPKGLQLRVNLNVMDGDKSLMGRIQGIVFTAEMEILAKLINHYQELTNKLQKSIEKTKTSLDHFKDTNEAIRGTYYDCKRELNLLEDKLTNHRYNKRRGLENFDDRINRIAEGDHPTSNRERDRPFSNRERDPPFYNRERDRPRGNIRDGEYGRNEYRQNYNYGPRQYMEDNRWSHEGGLIQQRDDRQDYQHRPTRQVEDRGNQEYRSTRQRNERDWNQQYGPTQYRDQDDWNPDQESPGPQELPVPMNNPSRSRPLMRRLTPPRLRQTTTWELSNIEPRYPNPDYHYSDQTQSSTTVGSQLGDFAKNLNALINQFQTLSTLLLQPSYR